MDTDIVILTQQSLDPKDGDIRKIEPIIIVYGQEVSYEMYYESRAEWVWWTLGDSYVKGKRNYYEDFDGHRSED